MVKENVFIPKILLCGDKADFFSQVRQRPFEIIGQVQFFGKVNEHELNFPRDGKFLFNDKLVGHEELPNMLRGGVDFLIFNESSVLTKVYKVLYGIGCPRSQFMTLREFNHLPLDGFYDMHADFQLLHLLKNLSIKTLLDADAHFVKSLLFTKDPNDLTEIDCICAEIFPPIKENIFRRVYQNFSECALKHYDAALIAERTPADFDNTFFMLENVADLVITFARHGSALDQYIRATAGKFAKVHLLPVSSGTWFFCYRHTNPQDFAMYVVTHKNLPPEHVQRLPEGYKIIHAGRALGEDFGYPGDSTGENISHLNPYLNEITALYWIYKNTKHDIIGLSHYRRFFTADGKSFLTREEIENLLKDYDIITDKLLINYTTASEILWNVICPQETTALAENIIRKNIMRTHPDYADAFNCKMNSSTCYYKNMFVTRRNVFNAYCEWLFSFMIDSTNEILTKTRLSELGSGEKRLPGHFSERMMTVWLMKNHLHIKEMPVMQVQGL